MTLHQLHEIPKFAELFDDERFKALMAHRRQNIRRAPLQTHTHAEAIIHTGGFRDGWLEALDIEELRKPPATDTPQPKQQLYSSR